MSKENNVSTPRPRGRPKSPGKRKAIIDAARNLFLQNGVDGVSLDVVIKSAAVSKSTFYSNFTNRAELFSAIVKQEAENLLQLDTWIGDQENTIEHDLTSFGVKALELVVRLDSIGIERMLGVQSENRKQLAKIFYDAGPKRTLTILANRIQSGMNHCELVEGDADLAASDFMALLTGDTRLKLSIGLIAVPNGVQIRKRVDRTVSLFLKMYGAN